MNVYILSEHESDGCCCETRVIDVFKFEPDAYRIAEILKHLKLGVTFMILKSVVYNQVLF
ncbi:hypothetical protein [Vallitalea okinawensis]|uniref:hypothetical protein n=1 Tax=Vallitalea okinawensis TaxID=2078660 RepID=UPI0013006174|nr:hypothetical protein [Vallitalea okinawensis]